jgi:hypothetical protein
MRSQKEYVAVKFGKAKEGLDYLGTVEVSLCSGAVSMNQSGMGVRKEVVEGQRARGKTIFFYFMTLTVLMLVRVI